MIPKTCRELHHIADDACAMDAHTVHMHGNINKLTATSNFQDRDEPRPIRTGPISATQPVGDYSVQRSSPGHRIHRHAWCTLYPSQAQFNTTTGGTPHVRHAWNPVKFRGVNHMANSWHGADGGV